MLKGAEIRWNFVKNTLKLRWFFKIFSAKNLRNNVLKLSEMRGTFSKKCAEKRLFFSIKPQHNNALKCAKLRRNFLRKVLKCS